MQKETRRGCDGTTWVVSVVWMLDAWLHEQVGRQP